MNTKIGLISDTHNTPASKWGLKDCDLIIHSGDFSFRGRPEEINQFFDDATYAIKKCGASGLVLVPGNHELGVQSNEESFKARCIDYDVICLIDEEYQFGDLKIYGTPRQPEFCNWAYNENQIDLTEYYSKIPLDTDILVTHCPSNTILDYSPMCGSVGSPELFKRVMEVKPKLHSFGHIHYSYGTKSFNDILFVNAAILDDYYRKKNEMIIVELDNNKKVINITP